MMPALKSGKNKALANKILTLGIVAFVLVMLSTPPTAKAAINEAIPFQGKVTNTDGTNVADGVYDFELKVYDGADSGASTLFTESWVATGLFSATMSSAPSSGGESLIYTGDSNESSLVVDQILWNTTKEEAVIVTSIDTGTNTLGISPTRQDWDTSDTITNKVYVKDGIFSININSLNANWGSVDFGTADLFVGVNFGPAGSLDGEMKPRIQMGATPYAFNAKEIDGIASGSFLRSDTSDNYTNGTLAFDSGTTLDVNGDLEIDDTAITFDGASTDFAFTGDFTINTDDFVVLNSSGNVGIGDTNPGDALDVAGNIDTTTYYELGDSKILDVENTDSLLVGLSAGASIVAGANYNTLIGDYAGQYINSSLGDLNTYVGYQAGTGAASGQSGTSNVAVGSSTLVDLTSGSLNIAIGANSGGTLATGQANILIGNSSYVTDAARTSAIAIGGNASAGADHSIAIGNYATTTSSGQLVIGSSHAGEYIDDIYIGGGVASFPLFETVINATGGNGTDRLGADLGLAGGKGTGNAAGGDILFYTSDAGASGSTLQSLTEKMRLTEIGLLGVGVNDPDAFVDIAASTTTYASLRLRSGATPSSPNVGDIYADGTDIFYYNGGWVDLTSGGTSYWAKSGTNLSPATAGDDVYLQTNELLGVGYDPSTLSTAVAAFNGSVGIGATDPGSNLLRIQGASDPSIGIVDTTNTVGTYLLATDTAGVVGTSTNHTFGISQNATTVITLDTDQQVGIGVADPDVQLEVLAAGTQLKLSYDGTDNTTFGTDTNGYLTVNTSGNRFLIDNTDEFVLGNWNGSNPTGTNGSMYYDVDESKFKCFQGGSWTDCIGTGGGSSVWSDLTTATDNLILSLGTYTSTFNSTATTGNPWTLTGNSLTSGYLQSLTSTSAGLTSGSLLSLDWSATGTNTATGDLFRINIGQDDTAGSFLNFFNNGTSVFKVSQSLFSTSLPTSFSAAGDVSVAYDLVFTNQTASTIKADGPLTIESGESFENLDLTLKPSGTGAVVIDDGNDLELYADQSVILDADDSADTYLTFENANNRIRYYVDGTELFRMDADCPAGTCNSSNGAVASSLSDLAENYPTLDETLEAGDVVVSTYRKIDASDTNSNYLVAKSGGENSSKPVLGVVSSKPGFLLGGGSFASDFCESVNDPNADLELVKTGLINIEKTRIVEQTKQDTGEEIDIETMELDDVTLNAIDDKIASCQGARQVPIALSGRVPVKADDINGVIKAGDLVTTSPVTPGSASKVKDAGWVIGRALTDYDAGSQTVVVFVFTSWFGGYGQTLGLNASDTEVNLSDSTKAKMSTLTITSSFISAGETKLSDTVIAGDLTVDGDIANVFGDLTFQGRKIVIDSNGDMYLTGDLKANKVVANGYVVDSKREDGTVKADATAGTATLTKGTTRLVINTSAVKANSLIFVTPESVVSVPLSVISKSEGVSFTVSTSSAVGSDVKFSWFIVQQE
ncbi:hypothetical protein KC614_00740 [candidate division WWE3 bacterium]|uniref:Uncharacterized protein n=1 Tax=candidate division WWE3 bacterium TaxID=2053526 RepID=A0A955LKV0_UNCKA|nr:hypothetical protein [candidate division WWE3 bacterium]